MEKTCFNCGTPITKEYCEDFPEVCEHWTKKKPMTNADRIRAMSDEELAEYLVEIGWDCHLCSEHERLSDNPLLRDERCDEKCKEHCLDWLKQPVKDGDNNE